MDSIKYLNTAGENALHIIEIILKNCLQSNFSDGTLFLCFSHYLLCVYVSVLLHFYAKLPPSRRKNVAECGRLCRSCNYQSTAVPTHMDTQNLPSAAATYMYISE